MCGPNPSGTREIQKRMLRIGPCFDMGHRRPADWPEPIQGLGHRDTVAASWPRHVLGQQSGREGGPTFKARSAGARWRRNDLNAERERTKPDCWYARPGARSHDDSRRSGAGGPSRKLGTSSRQRLPWRAVYQPRNRAGAPRSPLKCTTCVWYSAATRACAGTRRQETSPAGTWGTANAHHPGNPCGSQGGWSP